MKHASRNMTWWLPAVALGIGLLVLSMWTVAADGGSSFARVPVGEGEVQTAVSPASNIALHKPVTASQSLPDHPPEMAVDGILDIGAGNWWGAGGSAPQWIEIDLQAPASIAALRLYTSQSPAGDTLHRVWGRGPGESYRLLHEFEGYTVDDQLLRYTPPFPWQNVQFIKVETVTSPSWVSWQEIEVMAAERDYAVALPVVVAPLRPIIFHNGQVVTMEPGMPLAEALMVKGEKITAVGSDDEILALASPQTRLVDLDGRALLPGFVDAHTHLFNDAELHLGMTLEEAQQLGLQNGITTLADMFVPPEFLAQMQTFHNEGKLRIRTSLYLIYTTNCGDVVGDWYKQHEPTHEPGELLRIGGVKVFADGGSCGAPAVSEEFEPGAGLGDLWFTQEEMDTIVGEIDDAGYQVVVHAIGDRAVEQVQNSLETVLDGRPNELRHRIDHNAVLRQDLLPRYGQIGVVAAIFGHHSVCDLAPRTPFYQEWEWPWRKLLDANPGLHVAWHGDDPWVGPVSPILELYNMVTRREVAEDGTVCLPPDWLADTSITVQEALPMMNMGSAYAIFRDEEVGSLKPGKFADLIILPDSPLTVDPNTIKDLQVRMTMVGGEVAYCAPGQEALCP